MSLSTVAAGAFPVTAAGVTTPTSINSSYGLTLPTGIQMPGGVGGTLCCMLCIERADGTATATRMTFNGTTPTASVGMLLPTCSNVSPYIFVMRGQGLLSAVRFIGSSSGNLISYQFYIEDDRG